MAAIDFADCMIRYGRERYGKVHGPLFANSLTRSAQPRILAQPLFAEPKRVSKGLETAFRRFDFNIVLNYPGGLEPEGPHKVTVHGCDPYEDRDLYVLLFDLTRITGDPKYKAAATEALVWWFRHTRGPAGLFPWGEHLGWDLEYECPTYFDGPSKHLYAACYHEVKDEVPFLVFWHGCRPRETVGTRRWKNTRSVSGMHTSGTRRRAISVDMATIRARTIRAEGPGSLPSPAHRSAHCCVERK
ncbi:MAG: hypothetical protein QGF00_25830 [Planctomycetota bacterium]|nr:hypothetical protein [Planctomycetota bacterium]MDP7253050.1 hypothetical protein [Planctomycetota bacterium]